MVTATAASHAGAIRAAKTAPDTCSRSSTNRFVRLDPGNSSDAELAMSNDPYRNGSSESPCRRAASTSTGVRKATDVEVEHGRRRRDQHEEGYQQHHAVTPEPASDGCGAVEQAVAVRDLADQQESRHEHERRPGS